MSAVNIPMQIERARDGALAGKQHVVEAEAYLAAMNTLKHSESQANSGVCFWRSSAARARIPVSFRRGRPRV
jgi:hypothetical protein